LRPMITSSCLLSDFSRRLPGKGSLLLALMVHAVPGLGASLYQFTDLPPTHGNAYSRAFSINSSGHVVGFSNSSAGPTDISVWTGSNGFVLGSLGSIAYGLSINDADQIATKEANAVRIDSASGETKTLIGVGVYSSATAINNAGLVVGVAKTSMGNERALLWNPDVGTGAAATRDLGSLGGRPTDWSGAFGINELDEIAGISQDAAGRYHAVLWTHGATIDIGAAFSSNSISYDVNNTGLVIGEVNSGNPRNSGFVWKNGEITLLPFVPRSINDQGQIVGFTDTGSYPRGTPYLYQDGVLTDLSALSRVPGTIVNAFGINSGGQIVGGYLALDGIEHGYVLTPVPEPSTWFLLGAGLLVLGLRSTDTIRLHARSCPGRTSMCTFDCGDRSRPCCKL
jgi:probable HAF family extracellular repeat protein